MEALDKIKAFAAAAHGDQKRKYSREPFIRHPERVAAICAAYNPGLPALAAALLHDVLEDTATTLEDLERFLYKVMKPEAADKTVKLVIDLTEYPHLNRRSRKVKEAERLGRASAEAQTVKYADIMDNAIDVTKYDPDFSRVYLKESLRFLDKMDRGNPSLRRRAEDTVYACINGDHSMK